MLVFIIPLKSSQVSASWQHVCRLFERTLRSVCNQTSSEFRVIVVCNERPNLAFNHPHLTYIEVNFPVPAKDFVSREKDKLRRMLVGLTHARNMNPSHIMFVDADDCVSKYLVEFVSKNSHENGWFLGRGYEYREDIQLLKIRKRNFHLKTNTSHIIKFDLLASDLSMKLDDVRHENYILQHRYTVNILKSRGISLEPLPFIGVIYSVDNGENIWSQEKLFWTGDIGLKELVQFYGGKIRQFFIARPFTDYIREEFGIYDVNNYPNSVVEALQAD